MSSPEDRKEDRIYRKVSQRLRSLNWSGPHCVGQLGILKTLDAVVEGTDDDNANKIDVTLALQDHAMRALPKNTAEVLRISNGESGLALELVRRDLTEFSVLVRVLYASTEDQRAADDGLHRIHKALSPVVELHGALVSAGVDVEQRAWARSLALQLPNLRRLRSTPWHEVALVLKLIVLETEDDEGGEAEDGENSTTDTNVYDPTPWKNPPTRAEVRIVEELYSIGEGAPAIRQQVLGARLGLDVADQLEEMGIFDASTMTQQDARELTNAATEEADLNGTQNATVANTTKGLKVSFPDEKPSESFGSTPRALPALAGIATRLAPTLLKAAPKRYIASTLIKLKKEGGISSLSNKLSAMSSNAGSGGGKATSTRRSGLSGLVSNNKQVNNPRQVQAPDVEADVAAIELEKARLQATMDSVRQELDRVSVGGKNDEDLERAQNALDKAKAAVAPIEGWKSRIAPDATQTLQSSLQDERLTFSADDGTSAYASNEEIVAKASGGAALYGMNFFPTTTDLVIKPYTPLLATPSYVEMTGAVANFEAQVWQSTSVAKASSFHKISEHAGNSVAVQTTSSKGGSASASAPFGSVSGSHSTETEDGTGGTNLEEGEGSSADQTTTSTATVIEYIKCPMKSFRIPMTKMQLSDDAYKTALEVKNMRDAEEFLDAFGSHVSNGRQELGGIFYSTITVTSRTKMNTESMMSAASHQSSELKNKSRSTKASASGGAFGYSAKASLAFGESSSVGKTSVNTSATSKGTDKTSLEARYWQYIRCTGPRAPTPETFADALFNDNSSWAVTDRGPIEAFVPVTRVLENTMETLDDGSHEKIHLQSSVNYITAAWRKRAKQWGDVLLDEDNKLSKNVPSAVLDLIRTAYPTSQGVVRELVDAVYRCLQFVESPSDAIFWRDATSNPDSEGAAEKVAAAIRSAAAVATGGTSAPALLSYLDAEDVGVYVLNLMSRKEANNKAAFFSEMNDKIDTRTDTEADSSTDHSAHADDVDLEACWKKLPPLVRFGKYDHECKASDPAYFESLPLWEQRWIEKDDLFKQTGHEWEVADWELFQMEYFKAGIASTFLPKLARQLEETFIGHKDKSEVKGIAVRVVAAGTTETEELREAVNKAASGLNGDDWVLFEKVWATEHKSEETGRVMNIIQDHFNIMKTLYQTAPDAKRLRDAVALRDELRSMIESAKKFKAANLKEVGRIQAEIAQSKIDIDPDTGKEDPAQLRLVDDLKLELKAATEQGNLTTLQAVKAQTTDKKKLKDLGKRFSTQSVEHALFNRESGAETVVAYLRTQRANKMRDRIDYFKYDSYFVKPAPPETDADSDTDG